MKRSFKSLLTTITLSLLLTLNSAQSESREVAELKICEMGIRQCKMFVKDVRSYRICMRKNCESFYLDRNKKKSFEYTEEEDEFLRKVSLYSERQGQELEKVKICDYGQKKCNKLGKVSPSFYWECMIDSCNSQERFNYNEKCDIGKKTCQSKLDSYQRCMAYNCPKHRRTGKRICSNPEKVCADELDEFWGCMYHQCLGDIGKYINPYISREYVIVIQDGEEKVIKTNVDKSSYVPGGNGPGLRIAPKGVSPEEWSGDTASQYMLVGNPTDRMRCRNVGSKLRCITNDMRSCRCSDGTMPIYRQNAPRPLDIEDDEL